MKKSYLVALASLACCGDDHGSPDDARVSADGAVDASAIDAATLLDAAQYVSDASDASPPPKLDLTSIPCASGLDCESGTCELHASRDGGLCVAAPACVELGERCARDQDCCASNDGGGPYACIGGLCSFFDPL